MTLLREDLKIMPELKRGIYVGSNASLHEKSALLLITETELKAQFDDVSTGLGHGWHKFNFNEFILETE